MFSSLRSRILLGIYIFVIISIPVGAYLASQTTVFKSKASQDSPIVNRPPVATDSAVQELLDSSEEQALDDPFPTPTPEASSPTIATSFGPTLSLKVNLEGRPQDNQSTKLFVGIFEGALIDKPKFILSFSVDLPADGSYSNLSLAGLTSGTTYTAILKGTAQIASSATFVVSPTVTNLNNGEIINLITGDLNEDNTVTNADLAVAQKALGATKTSSNWNENADFNLDGIVNSFDLAIIYLNMNKVGASGVWTSPVPVATPSASLRQTPSVGAIEGGHWMWIP